MDAATFQSVDIQRVLKTKHNRTAAEMDLSTSAALLYKPRSRQRKGKVTDRVVT